MGDLPVWIGNEPEIPWEPEVPVERSVLLQTFLPLYSWQWLCKPTREWSLESWYQLMTMWRQTVQTWHVSLFLIANWSSTSRNSVEWSSLVSLQRVLVFLFALIFDLWFNYIRMSWEKLSDNLWGFFILDDHRRAHIYRGFWQGNLS